MSAALSAAFVFLVLPWSICAQDEPGLPQISAVIASGSVEEKRDALFQIRVIGTSEAAREAIPALSDPEPVVRATAAGSVGALTPAEVSQVLMPLLDDKEDFVKKEALAAIGKAGDRSSESRILRLLEREKDSEVRTAALRAAGGIGTYRSLTALTRILMQKPKDKDRFLRSSAARAIGAIARRDQGASGPFTTPESFLPPEFKGSSAPSQDLTDSGDDTPEDEFYYAAAASTLVEVLLNTRESDETRRNAAFALGGIGDRDALPELKRCAVSNDPYLAEVCREAIGKLSKAD